MSVVAAAPARENLRRTWYAFSRNGGSLFGLGIVVVVVLLTAFAPWVTPFPRHARAFTDFEHASLPPGSFALYHHRAQPFRAVGPGAPTRLEGSCS